MNMDGQMVELSLYHWTKSIMYQGRQVSTNRLGRYGLRRTTQTSIITGTKLQQTHAIGNISLCVRRAERRMQSKQVLYYHYFSGNVGYVGKVCLVSSQPSSNRLRWSAYQSQLRSQLPDSSTIHHCIQIPDHLR